MKRKPKRPKSAQHLKPHEYGEHCQIPTQDPPADFQRRLQSGPWARASTAVFYQRRLTDG